MPPPPPCSLHATCHHMHAPSNENLHQHQTTQLIDSLVDAVAALTHSGKPWKGRYNNNNNNNNNKSRGFQHQPARQYTGGGRRARAYDHAPNFNRAGSDPTGNSDPTGIRLPQRVHISAPTPTNRDSSVSTTGSDPIVIPNDPNTDRLQPTGQSQQQQHSHSLPNTSPVGPTLVQSSVELSVPTPNPQHTPSTTSCDAAPLDLTVKQPPAAHALRAPEASPPAKDARLDTREMAASNNPLQATSPTKVIRPDIQEVGACNGSPKAEHHYFLGQGSLLRSPV